jgi:hypothetical protein
LLAAQDRLALCEFDFATAEAGYNVALITLSRATGTMVNTQDMDDMLRSPCIAARKPNAAQSPFVGATPAANRAPQPVAAAAMLPPYPAVEQPVAQQVPYNVPQAQAVTQQAVTQQATPPWLLQRPPALEAPFPTLGMRLDQLEAR